MNKNVVKKSGVIVLFLFAFTGCGKNDTNHHHQNNSEINQASKEVSSKPKSADNQTSHSDSGTNPDSPGFAPSPAQHPKPAPDHNADSDFEPATPAQKPARTPTPKQQPKKQDNAPARAPKTPEEDPKPDSDSNTDADSEPAAPAQEPARTPAPNQQPKKYDNTPARAPRNEWKPGDPISELTIKQIRGMSKNSIRAIPLEDISRLTLEQLKAFVIVNFSGLQVSQFSLEQIQAFQIYNFKYKKPEFYADLTVDFISSFTNQHIGMLNYKNISAFNQAQMNALLSLSDEVLYNFQEIDLDFFTPYEIQNAKPEFHEFAQRMFLVNNYLNVFYSRYLVNLSSEQISSLSIDLFRRFDFEMFWYLKESHFRAFTPEQIANLKPKIREKLEEKLGINRDNQNTENAFEHEEENTFEDMDSNNHNHSIEKIEICEFLGLNTNSSVSQIKSAFKEAARRIHPDKNKAPDATQQMQKLNGLYQAFMEVIRSGT